MSPKLGGAQPRTSGSQRSSGHSQTSILGFSSFTQENCKTTGLLQPEEREHLFLDGSRVSAPVRSRQQGDKEMQVPGIQVRALTRFYGCRRASSRAVSFLFHRRVRYFFEEILYKNYRKTHIFELLICRDVEFTLCHIFRCSIVATRAPIVIPMAVTE